ncbi:MAG: hypothetical protein HY744_10210 [Deltaproteobacteria bacterium]|nr:hypothetical protein [Deltaproteobacteria bacterium]
MQRTMRILGLLCALLPAAGSAATGCSSDYEDTDTCRPATTAAGASATPSPGPRSLITGNAQAAVAVSRGVQGDGNSGAHVAEPDLLRRDSRGPNVAARGVP